MVTKRSRRPNNASSSTSSSSSSSDQAGHNLRQKQWYSYNVFSDNMIVKHKAMVDTVKDCYAASAAASAAASDSENQSESGGESSASWLIEISEDDADDDELEVADAIAEVREG